MVSDFGRGTIKHLWIDLDSWKHSEIWLHVFRKQLYYRNEEGESIPPERLIVLEEGGFGVGFGGREEVRMKIMTREEFKKEYEIDVPELFEEVPIAQLVSAIDSKSSHPGSSPGGDALTPKQLVERLLEVKCSRAEEAMKVSGLKTDPVDKEAWIARAAEIQITITDLEMLLERL